MLWLVFIMCGLLDFSDAFSLCDKKCNYRGSCENEFSSLAVDPCICNKYSDRTDRTRFKYGGRDCKVVRKCWKDIDCYAGGCNYGLCECHNGWEGAQCNYEERCPANQCNGHGKCKNTHRLKQMVNPVISGYRRNFNGIYSRVENPCECDNGWHGEWCDIDLHLSCSNRGVLAYGRCQCADGYSGTNCELCEKCNFNGRCGGSSRLSDNVNGGCVCEDGYVGDTCACKINQCGIGGRCQTNGVCSCEDGFIGSDCSGHGTCNVSGCTCDHGFEGESCNICNGCDTYDGEYAEKRGTYLEREDYVVRLREKPTEHLYREYNKAPWQAVKIPDANTVDKCYDECMSMGKQTAPRKSTTYGRPVTRWADRLDWSGYDVTSYRRRPEYMYNSDFVYRTLTSTSSKRISNYELEIYGDLGYDLLTQDLRDEFINNYFEVPKDDPFTDTDILKYYRGNSPYQNYYYENRDEYKTTNRVKTAVRLLTGTYSFCDDFSLKYRETYATYSITAGYNWHNIKWHNERFCVPSEDVPPAPLYDYTMRNFWSTYDIDSVTHFEFLGNDCLCYTGTDEDVGKTKSLEFDSRVTSWDTLWKEDDTVEWGGVGRINTESLYEKVSRRDSYFLRRNGIYVAPCKVGEYSLGTHCCLVGMAPSEPGALDCSKNIACDPNPCEADVNGNPVQCVNSINANDYTGPIPEGSFVCQCSLRATGNDCELPCCERGDDVYAVAPGDVFPAATVHGECDYGVGGCKCDYGYFGYKCQCTDSMCVHGFCNGDLEDEDSVSPGDMCICHPGYERDATGVCTINVDDCDPNQCQNGGVCVDLADAYHCECPLGYVGDNCEQPTGWDQGSTSCGVNEYLVSGRCIDCPFGTYSLAGSTTCRVKLTDDNIHHAVEEAMSDDPHYIVSRSQICTTGSMGSLSAHTALGCFEACPDDTVSIIVTGLCYCVIEEVDIASAECQQVISSPHNGGYVDGVYYNIWYHSEPGSGYSGGSSGRSIYTKTFYNFYGDITTFDTSKVTNMDNLFLNKAVPDISGWNIDSVTSMRNMFAGSTGVFDRTNWNITSKDATNIYAGSDLQSHTLPTGLELQYVDEFAERTSGSCLDNQESEVRPVMSTLECLYAQYDATNTFSNTVTVTNLLPSAGRAGCRYPVAADSHEFTFRSLNINDLEVCTSEVPCLCAKIRPGEYVKADACEGVYEHITSVEECTIAVRHLGEFYGVMDLTNGLCVHNQPVCKMQSYSPCDGTTDCIHNGLLCKSGVIIDDTCKLDNEALRDMVQLWNLYPDASLWLYGPLKDWDVHYVTDTTDLFKNMQNDPDITLWDMSNVVHTDGMFAGSSFNHPIDNKDFSSLQSAKGMLPKDYSHRACGKHFLRVGKGESTEGFEGHGDCLRSELVNGKSTIQKAVDDWFDGDRNAVIAKYGVMSEWDVSEVETMQGLFKNRTSIPSLVKWDVSKVTNMVSMFEISGLNEDIRHWDVRKVADFSSMFKGTTQFAVDLTTWEIHASEHQDMFYGNPYFDDITFLIDETLPEILTDVTFRDALTGWFGSDRADTIETYGKISDWLTFQVTDMSGAFKDKEFNEDISRWVVSSVTDMSSMFENSAFNSDISGWEVVNVKNMNSMFKDSPFNQMIDRWNVFNVADMSHMFENTPFSRPIGDWDLFGTEPNEIQAANDLNNDWCIVSTGFTVNVDEYNRASLAARRRCFDVCTDLYPETLPDIEGRNRIRGGGRVGKHYTPYRGGFGMVTNELYNHTCMCADDTVECDSGVTSPFDYVYDYRDMKTIDMFRGNTEFVQPLCGLGWRYRDVTSLGLNQQQVSLSCDICIPGQHMSECGLCLGEFQFDRCMDSSLGFTLDELRQLKLTVEVGGETKVIPSACNCEYEDGMKGCLVVNGRRQVRMIEWYSDGETDFSAHISDQTQYFCEVNFLDDRPVANAEGFNSVTCTEDTLLDRFECGLVGGNWDGSCDKCLEACDPPELGNKFVSVDRTCTACPNGMTVFQNECVQCPDGKFTSEDHVYCGKCPQGTYGENGECFTCGDGTISTFDGAIQCQVCGNNTYSVGTECLSCAVNEVSPPGSNYCTEARYCWHGNTSVGDSVGNFCEKDTCRGNFTHVGDTCVSTCKFGNVTKVGGEHMCLCRGKWQGTECDVCLAEFDFTYLDPEMCVEHTCSDTLVTDCYCSPNEVVKGNKFCYAGNVVEKCITGGSKCMCDMGDGYEWAPEDTTCIGGKIAKDCDLFANASVPSEPCSNADYTCEYGLRDNLCTNAFKCEARHFEPGADCCYSGHCYHVTCQENQYNTGGLYVDYSECCSERELCSDAGFTCGLRTGRKLRVKEQSTRALSVFQSGAEFDSVCCEDVPYKLHPHSECANYFAERALTAGECAEYVTVYDQTQGYSSPVMFGGECVMERTFGGINTTSVVCIQEV